MTARELFIEIEDKLNESLALCYMVASAAASDGVELDSDSVARVMAIAVTDLREVIKICKDSE